MNELIFASNNEYKLKEVRSILKGRSVKSLADVGIAEDITETGNTLEDNAFIKAKLVYEKTGSDCFADDTGLFVEALGGAPGVFSARFAGKRCTAVDNIIKLLRLMDNQVKRKAKFKTVICLLQNGDKKFFEGVIYGTISNEPRGENGFGYDPVFIPYGLNKTLAELTLEEKNSLSHRALAVFQMRKYFEATTKKS